MNLLKQQKSFSKTVYSKPFDLLRLKRLNKVLSIWTINPTNTISQAQYPLENKAACLSILKSKIIGESKFYAYA